MKRLSAILFVAVLLPITALAGTDWTGASSSAWNDIGNWGNSAISTTARLSPADMYANAGWPTSKPFVPIVDSSVNGQYYNARIRGAGTVFYQTGGTLEFQNGTGTTEKGVSFYSRATLYPASTTYGPAASAANPTVASLTGGTFIVDQLGVGTPQSAGFFIGFPSGGTASGTKEANTGAYAQDGWGRLVIGGTSTFVVRPNKYDSVNPAGYAETTPFWSYTGVGSTAWHRVFGIAIAPGSQIVLSDNGRLIVPLPLYAGDKDLVADLQYYQGIGRLVSGPGSNPINYELFPGDGMQDGVAGGLLGGYAIVSVPEPGSMVLLGVGLAGFLIFRRRS